MAHAALYRRYRPQRFAEVRGQDHVIKALQTAVAEGRHSHAYLFSGPRGTGKTSTARILAKALNCEHLVAGEPCGECESCKAIETGTSYDLQELDAASNNRVENVRELIERVALGSPGRTKVYILDEVHMLSTGAANALLKTLEEPPDHVVFVLATTDPQKVLPTIRSRTQHFPFHLLPGAELEEHVRHVIADAGLDVDDDAIEQVLRAGGGSARDTLSALDQVAAGGVADESDAPEALVRAYLAADTATALRTVAEAMAAGSDPRILGEGFLARLRDVFLHRMGAPLDHLGEADRAQVAEWAATGSDRGITRALEEVGAALLEMRQAPDARIPLEVALVRLTREDTGTDVGALLNRIERLERAIASGAGAGPTAPTGGSDGGEEGAAEPSGRSEAAPSPPPGRSRPGDAARAALATAAGSGPPPPRPRKAATTAPPAEPASTSAPPAEPASTTPAAESEPTPGLAAPEAQPVEAPAPAAAPAAAGGAAPDASTFRAGWSDSVLPKLGGLTKAMYSAARVAEVSESGVVLAVPNEVHQQRCEQKRSEVEEALAAHFGRPFAVRFTVDAGAVPSEAPSGPRPGSAGTDPGPDDDDVHPAEVAHLEDAPADDSTAADRLLAAFGGEIEEQQ